MVSAKWARLIGVAKWPTKRHYLWPLWTVPNDSKHIQASFLIISIDRLRLQIAQMPRCRDLAIFVVLTITDRQTDYFTLAQVRRVMILNASSSWLDSRIYLLYCPCFCADYDTTGRKWYYIDPIALCPSIVHWTRILISTPPKHAVISGLLKKCFLIATASLLLQLYSLPLIIQTLIIHILNSPNSESNRS